MNGTSSVSRSMSATTEWDQFIRLLSCVSSFLTCTVNSGTHAPSLARTTPLPVQFSTNFLQLRKESTHSATSSRWRISLSFRFPVINELDLKESLWPLFLNLQEKSYHRPSNLTVPLAVHRHRPGLVRRRSEPGSVSQWVLPGTRTEDDCTGDSRTPLIPALQCPSVKASPVLPGSPCTSVASPRKNTIPIGCRRPAEYDANQQKNLFIQQDTRTDEYQALSNLTVPVCWNSTNTSVKTGGAYDKLALYDQ